ncbi:MAG: helix-turn-helix domain-containing protein [Acetobacter sp.]
MSVSGHEYSFVSGYWQVMTDDKEIALPADPNDPEDRPVSKSGLVMAHRGRKLRMARAGLGLSQEAFAGLLGVSSVELLAWEQASPEDTGRCFCQIIGH